MRRLNKFESAYLTQEEVDRLPIGTRVIVTWGGGNGPCEYTITRKIGKHAHIEGLSSNSGTLRHVGTDFWDAKVILPHEAEVVADSPPSAERLHGCTEPGCGKEAVVCKRHGRFCCDHA
jgi:hypothetical protein